MKVLIIALPRTGSTTLLTKVAEDRNLKLMFEPFDGSNRYEYKSTDDFVVVKTIIHQYPSNIIPSDRLDWLIEFSKEFDDVILLSRRNIEELYQSYSYFLYYKNKGFNSLSEYKWEMTPNYNEVVDIVNSMLVDIKFISKSLNIPITYYENVYDVNSANRLRKFKNTNEKLI